MCKGRLEAARKTPSHSDGIIVLMSTTSERDSPYPYIYLGDHLTADPVTNRITRFYYNFLPNVGNYGQIIKQFQYSALKVQFLGLIKIIKADTITEFFSCLRIHKEGFLNFCR